MLEKVKMLIDNNGVGAVKKFTPPITPPKSCLQGGVKCLSGGGEKNFGALRAPFLPLYQISPHPRSFPRSASVSLYSFRYTSSTKTNFIITHSS